MRKINILGTHLFWNVTPCVWVCRRRRFVLHAVQPPRRWRRYDRSKHQTPHRNTLACCGTLISQNYSCGQNSVHVSSVTTNYAIRRTLSSRGRFVRISARSGGAFQRHRRLQMRELLTHHVTAEQSDRVEWRPAICAVHCCIVTA